MALSLGGLEKEVMQSYKLCKIRRENDLYISHRLYTDEYRRGDDEIPVMSV